ncbi:hypothetical protein [Bacillus sp. FSL E2-8895]
MVHFANLGEALITTGLSKVKAAILIIVLFIIVAIFVLITHFLHGMSV